jgi:hypothetical protein
LTGKLERFEKVLCFQRHNEELLQGKFLNLFRERRKAHRFFPEQLLRHFGFNLIKFMIVCYEKNFAKVDD